MEHFPAPLDRVESDEVAVRIERCFERDGFGFWALELPGEAPFIGFTGLSRVREDVPFAPAIEIGWRLAAGYWGRGLASEAARAAAADGFSSYGLEELTAYTAERNTRSRAVMERLGMSHDAAGDFDHPALAQGHPLAHHVVYRLRAPHTGG